MVLGILKGLRTTSGEDGDRSYPTDFPAEIKVPGTEEQDQGSAGF